MQRIAVVGPPGSGKTSLARNLARHLRIPYIEMDALFWGPNWTVTPEEAFRARITAAVAGDRWVADGNYSIVRPLVWGRADTLVWLDYSLPRTMWYLLRRTVGRLFTREELWQGNREQFRTTFFSRDSLLLYAMQTHRRRRRAYRHVLTLPEHAHLRVVHLRTPPEADRWLAGL